MGADCALIALLRRVAAGGDLEPDEVMALATASFGRQAATAWHQLVHWIEDADIRVGDVEYERLQRKELALLLEGLED